MTLTTEQIKNLLRNAYGFADDRGMMYSCTSHMIGDRIFELASPDEDFITFVYEGATLSNGTANFTTKNGNIESFDVLVVATESVNVHGLLVEDYLLK